jgi:hypothetical protein
MWGGLPGGSFAGTTYNPLTSMLGAAAAGTSGVSSTQVMIWLAAMMPPPFLYQRQPLSDMHFLTTLRVKCF